MIDNPLDLLITGAVLLDPVDGLAQSANLGIRGQRIAHVGPADQAAPKAVRHLHLPGRVVVSRSDGLIGFSSPISHPSP